MILLITVLVLLFAGSCVLGYKQMLRVEHLNHRNLSRTFAAAIVVLSLLTVAHWIGIFAQWITARVTMGLYSVAAGFFPGTAFKLFRLRQKAGPVEYMYRSFWVDVMPNLIGIFLFVFGVYRTGLLTAAPFTGIGITSGMSLVGFGLFIFTLRVVPEFRTRGILLLDQYIGWDHVISYKWHTEDAVQIDYILQDEIITEFVTSIPPEDQLAVERLLTQKIQEHEEERRQHLFKDDDH